MNWRRSAYLAYASSRGYRFPSSLQRYVSEHRSGIDPKTTPTALSRLLAHCQRSVPYFAELLPSASTGEIEQEPVGVLKRLPLLTKNLIRANFNRLQSDDNSRRIDFEFCGQLPALLSGKFRYTISEVGV